MCGRPRGHPFDLNCSIAGSVGGLSKWGERKVPLSEWGPPFIRATKGLIKLASDDPSGLLDLWLVEREAAGDPNIGHYKRLVKIGNLESLEELFSYFSKDAIVKEVQAQGQAATEAAVAKKLNEHIHRARGKSGKPRDYCGDAQTAVEVGSAARKVHDTI